MMPTIKTTNSYNEAITKVIDYETRAVYIAPSNDHAVVYAAFVYECNREGGKYEKNAKQCQFLTENSVIIINPNDLPEGLTHGLYVAGYLTRHVKSSYAFAYGSKDFTDKETINHINKALEETGVKKLKHQFTSKKDLKPIWNEVAFHLVWVSTFTAAMVDSRENYRKNERIRLDAEKNEYHDMIAKALDTLKSDGEIGNFNRENKWSGALSDEWFGNVYAKGKTIADNEIASRVKLEVCKYSSYKEYYIRYHTSYNTSGVINNPTVDRIVKLLSAVKNFVQVAHECEK